MEIRKNPQIDVVSLYRSGLPLRDICAQAGITRQAVRKRLKALGVPLDRMAGRVPAVCSECGKDFLSTRKSRTNSAPKQKMCSQACYYAYLRNPTFVLS